MYSHFRGAEILVSLIKKYTCVSLIMLLIDSNLCFSLLHLGSRDARAVQVLISQARK